MSGHVISNADVDEWLRQPQWITIALSSGGGSNKSLEVDAVGRPKVFRVISHGETIFLGADQEAAVRRYNEAR